MACGGCGSRRRARENANKNTYDVMGGYKYLPERQLKARLETFKKIHCSTCGKRYKCDFSVYTACKDRIK